MKKYFLIFMAGLLAAAIPTTFAISKIFSDISGNEWYSHAVTSLSDKGIIEGYDDGTFKPSESVNRAELAVMMDRVLEHERLLDTKCDKLAAYGTMPWFASLNQKYTEMYWKPMGNSAPAGADVGSEYGQGCMVSGDDILVFMPGQDAFGCHEIWKYDIRTSTLERAVSKDAYCANYFTDVTSEYASFSGSNCEGGPCHKDYGKYYFKDNNIEVVTEAMPKV